jgi:heterotetrameric sarcosine oxidase gamma subunit
MSNLANSKPLARSPLGHRLAVEGAVFSESSGWLTADHFGNAREEAESARSGVGLADCSFAGKWDLQGADLEQALRRVMEASTIPEPGRAAACEGGFVCRLVRDHALLILEQPGATLPDALYKQDAGPCLHVVDRTSGYGRLVLSGPKGRPVLGKVTPLDLREKTFPDLSCTWSPMSGVRVLLLRRDRGRWPGYEVMVSREYAEYLWDTLIKAGKEHGIRVMGFEAIRLLEAF